MSSALDRLALVVRVDGENETQRRNASGKETKRRHATGTMQRLLACPLHCPLVAWSVPSEYW